MRFLRTRVLLNPILILFFGLVVLSLAQLYLINGLGNPSILSNFVLIAFSTVILHYYFNLLHIGSHYGISKNKRLNNFVSTACATLSGHTYAAFATTHATHHKFPGDSKKDPDYDITHGSFVLFLPFKIFLHDLWFFNKALYKQKGRLFNYILTRSIQAVLVILIVANGYLSVFLMYWLLPIYILGVLNGIFLFYLPHNVSKFETILSSLSSIKLFSKLSSLIENVIFISRISHESHHDDIRSKNPYFPFIYYFLNRNRLKKETRFKYIAS